jgi:3-oxoadipate enol-lactonase
MQMGPASRSTVRLSDGRTLSFVQHGTGPITLTLLPAIGLDASWFFSVFDWELEGVSLLAVDLPGHGGSSPRRPVGTLEQTAIDVVALWDTLGIDSSAVLGVSLGGMVAQAIARAAPGRVAALVLMNTISTLDEAGRAVMTERASRAADPRTREALAEETLQRWFGAPAVADAGAIVTKAREALKASDPETHAGYWQAISEIGFEDELPEELAPPTLAIGGEADLSTPPHAVRRMAATFPHAEIRIVPGGHLVLFENPEQVKDVIQDFLHRALHEHSLRSEH